MNISSIIRVGVPVDPPRGPGPHRCLVISLGRTQARGICSHHRERIPRPTFIGFWPALVIMFVVVVLTPVVLMLHPGSLQVFRLLILLPIVDFVEVPKIGRTSYLHLPRWWPPRFYDLGLLLVVILSLRDKVLCCRWTCCCYHKDRQAYVGRNHLRPDGVSVLWLRIFEVRYHGFLIRRRKYRVLISGHISRCFKYRGPLSIRKYLDRGP